MTEHRLHDVELSNLDKMLYPDDGVTKGDVIEYSRTVADAMLPHLAGRPLVLHRFPDGIGTQGFVQHDVGKHFPDWIQVADLPRRGGEGEVRHVVCEDVPTLIYLANQAALELHIWPSTVDNPEHPDRLVIDIDPPDGTGVATLRSVARRVRDLYEKVGLVPFVQATGGRGFHVVALHAETLGPQERPVVDDGQGRHRTERRQDSTRRVAVRTFRGQATW